MARNRASNNTAIAFSLEPRELDMVVKGIELLAEQTDDAEELHESISLMAYLTAKIGRRERRVKMTQRRTWAERSAMAATPGMTRAQMTARRPAP